MASPLNRRNRRTSPYVVMNNHTQPPSVAYSARQPDQEQLNNNEHGIQVLTNTPLQQPNQKQYRTATQSLFDIAQRIQVCYFALENFRVVLQLYFFSVQ